MVLKSLLVFNHAILRIQIDGEKKNTEYITVMHNISNETRRLITRQMCQYLLNAKD